MAKHSRPPARPSLLSLALAEVCRQQRARTDPPVRQIDIAQRADVTEATVQRIERGHWPTDPFTLERVLDAYGRGNLWMWISAARLAAEWQQPEGARPQWVLEPLSEYLTRLPGYAELVRERTT